jgi:arylsulfatase A-like enzyme
MKSSKMKLLPIFLFLSTSTFAQQRPNIIYIMSDDHDADAISAYNTRLISTPHIDRIAREGTLFTRAFVGNSICGPARATLLTGQHSHKNLHKDNRTRFDSSRLTMPKILQQNGYQTAIVGKWHLISYPTGFDYWKILPGQGLYSDPRFISMDGDTSTLKGYAADVITDEAIKWLDNRDRNKPFLLLLHHKSPHRYFLPSLKYAREYRHKKIPEPSTLYTDTVGRGKAWQLQTMSILRDMRLCTDLKVDPASIMGLPEYSPDSADARNYRVIFNRIPDDERKQLQEIYAERGRILQTLRPQGKELLKYKYQWYMQDYLACVASVDEGVGRVLDYLDRNGLTGNTLLVYTSDQGMYLGENGWFDKRWMYDVSMQSPLMMRWPGKIRPGSRINTMVQNIDYAPTFLGAAGVEIPGFMQGINLVPLITEKVNSLSRDNLYYHFYEYRADHTVLQHLGIRGTRYKLIYFYPVEEWELYDLFRDPREQKNLVHIRRFRKTFEKMKKELMKLRDDYDDHEKAGVLE